jgi:hypothetical protein
MGLGRGDAEQVGFEPCKRGNSAFVRLVVPFDALRRVTRNNTQPGVNGKLLLGTIRSAQALVKVLPALS